MTYVPEILADIAQDRLTGNSASAGESGSKPAVGVWRREDTRFTTGAGRYLADLPAGRSLYATFVRSTSAHARVVSIDPSSAITRSGVLAVFTASDMQGRAKAIRAPYSVPSYWESDYPILADRVVRFVGEPVALVVAETPEAAELGASDVVVDYTDPLPVVDHIATLLGESDGTDVPGRASSEPQWRMDEARDFGDLTAALSDDSIFVEDVFWTQRLAASPLECRGAIVEFDRGTGRYTITTGTQVPYTVRFGLSESLGIDEELIRIVVPDIGGGFGNKTTLDPELVALAVASKRFDLPIRWIEERSENMIASTHGQEERIWLRLWADAQGTFLGLESDIIVDGGAYSSYPDTPCNEAMNCGMSMVGAYRFDHYRFRARVAITNTVPNGAYRGVARPQANFALERLVDDLAHRLELDPIELRRRNMVRPGDMPYRTITGLERDSGNYAAGMDLAVRAIRKTLESEPSALDSSGRFRVGIGVACFAEEAAWGTKTRIPKRNYSIPGYDGARITMNARGRVTLYTSAISSGQGHETAFAHLAAQCLGLPVDWISVRQGDTDLVPYGHGSTGSRSAVSTGGAIIKSCGLLKSQLLQLASEELGDQVSVAELDIHDGVVHHSTEPEQSIPVVDLAWIAYRREEPVDRSRDPGLEAISYYDPPDHGVSALSVHAAAVKVDVDTGTVSIVKYVVVEDAGRLLHPTIVDGQIRGGVAQGIGKTLYEELCYDDTGQPLTVGFSSYLLPTAVEVPDIEIIHMSTPSPLTVGGMKGCGESGVIGPPAAIGNAISNAFSGVVRPNRLPYRPERVYQWISQAVHDATSQAGR